MSLTVNDQNLGHATAYGYAKSQGYTGTEEQFAELMASYATVAQSAAASAEAAAADALKSEGYAVGKQNGSSVGSGSPYYHANAEYYKNQASGSATTATQKATAASGSADSAAADALKAEGFARGKQNGSDVGSSSPYYHANAEYYKDQASESATTATQKATAASGSADSAAADALKAEGFAVGEQNGTAVASGSPYYNNNAEYFKDQAAADAAHCDEVAGSIPADYSALSSDVSLLRIMEKLEEENIPGTTQTVTTDSSGKVTQITHKNGSNVMIRTDAFTYATATITEVRTLNSGESLTVVINTNTLETTTTYAAA